MRYQSFKPTQSHEVLDDSFYLDGDYISDTALEEAFIEDVKQLGAELDTLEMALPARQALPRQKKSKRADAGAQPSIKN